MTPKYGRPFDHTAKNSAGQVYGISNAAWEQGGQLYNGNYDPIDESGAILPLAPGVTKQAPPPPKRKGSAKDRTMAPAPVDPGDEIDDEGTIDLKLWAEGGLPQLEWFVVQAAVLDQLGFAVDDADEAREAINAKA